jgi:hypothetical protein
MAPQAVRRDVLRAEKVLPEIQAEIINTPLDKGAVLDRLARAKPEQQREVLEQIKSEAEQRSASKAKKPPPALPVAAPPSPREIAFGGAKLRQLDGVCGVGLHRPPFCQWQSLPLV